MFSSPIFVVDNRFTDVEVLNVIGSVAVIATVVAVVVVAVVIIVVVFVVAVVVEVFVRLNVVISGLTEVVVGGGACVVFRVVGCAVVTLVIVVFRKVVRAVAGVVVCCLFGSCVVTATDVFWTGPSVSLQSPRLKSSKAKSLL